jgi:hypothetical protein
VRVRLYNPGSGVPPALSGRILDSAGRPIRDPPFQGVQAAFEIEKPWSELWS